MRLRVGVSVLALVLSACAVEAPPPDAPAEIGVTYRYELYTHCGLGDARILLDGSEWLIEGDDGGSNPPAGFGNPTDVGDVTLTGPDHGVYRSSQGVQRTIVRDRDVDPAEDDLLIGCV